MVVRAQHPLLLPLRSVRRLRSQRLVTAESFRVLVFCLLVTLVSPAVPAEQMRGVSVDDWQGFTVLAGGKGYAPTPMGQVHYRDIGPRDYEYPIILMHQSPMSMIQFAEIQNAFSAIGVRAITLDTPGYGMSDLPPKQPTLTEFADNIVHVLEHLNLDKVVVAGHHTGAKLAAAFAANHPDRTAAVVLHSAAIRTMEEKEAAINMQRIPRTPLADGSHLARSFQPQTPPASESLLIAKTWGTITRYIQGPDIVHYAAYLYDLKSDLNVITAPGLFLSDLQDANHELDLIAVGLRPDFKYVEFSKGGASELMAQPHRWVRIVADFMESAKARQDTTTLDR